MNCTPQPTPTAIATITVRRAHATIEPGRYSAWPSTTHKPWLRKGQAGRRGGGTWSSDISTIGSRAATRATTASKQPSCPNVLMLATKNLDAPPWCSPSHTSAFAAFTQAHRSGPLVPGNGARWHATEHAVWIPWVREQRAPQLPWLPGTRVGSLHRSGRTRRPSGRPTSAGSTSYAPQLATAPAGAGGGR